MFSKKSVRVTLAIKDEIGMRRLKWSRRKAPAAGALLFLFSCVGVANAAAPVIATVVNGGSFEAPLAGGTLATIFGSNLAASTCVAPGGGATVLTLCGVTVSTGTVATPISSVSPLQVNIEIPVELAAGTMPLVVLTNANAAPTATSNSVPISLGIFAPALLSLNASGTGVGIFNDLTTGALINPANNILALPGRS